MTQNIIQNTTQNPTQNKIPNPTAPLSDHIQQALQTAKQTQDKAFITALGRGMLVLSVFEQQQQLTHQQICDKTQLPKATVSRLIHTLLQLNVLKRDSNDSYQLGKNLLALSNSWPVQDMVEQSMPLLREFAQAHQVSVNIATESEGEMRYLACYRSPARLAVNLTVGSTVPLDKTAIGRAFYVAQTPSMQQQMIDSLPYPPVSDEQSKALTNLAAATAFFEQHGYTLSDGEYSPDILAVAVPLYDSIEGRYTHSLNASVPRASWDAQDYIDFIVPKLQALARQIEAL
ncbi:IclR family transcriptional regulator [Psychrobacter sp. FDAARGOS_221]|uniref:IclR family transcriptional regulator n=1 Tax=Psychrobacter sp. FDAARGOS_221 TaxID=1975705 RepID=UPI000BB57D8A|nr:IclR family transcriptional regulator C-terminal domain-containing protein [Psychrobacter sp. FDAARGOS_221]PNK59846.1 IclR family transcriptional regulator [Psychrobacter sp. FDAARGOS_221]